MNILIIGLGYVGKAFALRLKKQGHHVTGTTRHPDKAAHLQPYVDQVLIWNDKTPKTFLDGFDVVLLSAAPDSTSNYEETYLKNAEKIAQAAAFSSTTQQILYTSSTSIYGDCNGAQVTEETSPAPKNRQGEILLATETALLQSSVPCCILRLGEIIGPGRELSERLAKMQGTPLPGTGENRVNLSPLEDIVNALLFAMENRLSGIYNVVADFHPTRKELYLEIAKKKGLKDPVWDPALPSLHGGNRIVSSQKLLDAHFAFEPIKLL